MSSKHVGLVVSDTLVTEELIRNHVVEFITSENNECTHVLAHVGQAAFRFEANGAVDMAFVKNQKRRAERPLQFGDVIEWYDEDVSNRVISKFHRCAELFEQRLNDQKFQILVPGVVSPKDKFLFWSEYFPNVRVGMKASQDVLPDVTVSAWLNLSVDTDGKFRVEFDSFERVEAEGSIVSTAPWNRNNSKFSTLTIPFADDALENQILPPDSLSEYEEMKQVVYGFEGICTGARLLYCAKLPKCEIVIALIKHSKDAIPLTIGVTVEFDAVWNEYDKRYNVTRYRTKGVPSKLGANGLLRTSVKAVEGCPGLFKSDQFGFIDDPSGVLALLHLSAYQRSSVVVTLEDKPSHHAEMRFRIVDVQPDKAAKLEKWMKENEVVEVKNVKSGHLRSCSLRLGHHIGTSEGADLFLPTAPAVIVVNDAKGVAINESTVYSKDHANIFFEVPDDLRSDFSPGQMVTFSAQYHNDTKKFLVTKICAMPGDGVTFVERTVPGHEAPQKVFRVEAERMKHLNSFLNSSVFGLLDVAKPLSLPGGKRKPLTVWVRQSLPGPEETTRPHHTSFVVVSIGEEEPKDEVVAPSVAEESPSEEPKEEVETPSPEPDLEEQIRRAMERLGLIGDTTPVITHEPECTPIKCAASCETWKAVIMLDTVPNFWEILAAKNPVFFTECVNKLFS